MKNLYLAVLLLLISPLFSPVVFSQDCDGITVESITNPGPFEVETLTEADGIRNGPDYLGATIYYPTNASPPYASIAIVPGYTAPPSTVEEWGPFYASHGIVCIIIGTNSPTDLPEARAIALLDALETIKQENSRVSSPLEGTLNLNQLAVSGWSMGGGGAQRAAVLDNTIAGVVALCPWLPSPQLDHQSPVLIFSGEVDPVAPPAEHADIHYQVTPKTTDKLLFEIANGDHWVANTPTGGNGSAGKIAISWLKLYVEENDCYCPLLTDELLVNPPDASKVEQSFECELLGINDQESSIGFYPNPSSVFINISGLTNTENYKIYTIIGSEIFTGTISESEKINIQNLTNGLYFLKLENKKVIKFSNFY